MLLEPFLECAFDVVVSADPVASAGACSGVLIVGVKWVLALCYGGGVVARGLSVV